MLRAKIGDRDADDDGADSALCVIQRALLRVCEYRSTVRPRDVVTMLYYVIARARRALLFAAILIIIEIDEWR